MNVLKYIKQRDFKEGADYLFSKRILIAFKHHGRGCKLCGHVQGTPKKGFSRYYCKHLRNKITKELEKEKEKINKSFCEFVAFLYFAVDGQDDNNGIPPNNSPAPRKGLATEPQIELMAKLNIDYSEKTTIKEASNKIDEALKKQKEGGKK